MTQIGISYIKIGFNFLNNSEFYAGYGVEMMVYPIKLF